MLFTIFYIIKIILLIFIAALGVGIVWAWKKSLPLRAKLTPRETLKQLKTLEVSEGRYRIVNREREAARKKWAALEEKIRLPDEHNMRLAIIEADNIIDELLTAYGLAGDDMGSRLKSINRESLKSLRDLWAAHRFRNQLVHDIDFHPSPEEMKTNLDLFYKSLEELLNKKIEAR